MNEQTGVSIGDALSLMNRSGSGMFCGGGDGWIGLIIILAILGGGFGGWGGNNASLNGALTRAELYDSQQLQTIQMNQSQNQRDMCQSTATLSNQINNRAYEGQIANNNGFANLTNGITQIGYQIQDCCCGINRSIDGVNYNIQNQTMQLMQNENCNTQKILDTLCGMKMEAKDTRIAEQAQLINNLQLQLSQIKTVDTLRPQAPVPAFNVPAPWYSSGVCGNNCCA